MKYDLTLLVDGLKTNEVNTPELKIIRHGASGVIRHPIRVADPRKGVFMSFVMHQ